MISCRNIPSIIVSETTREIINRIGSDNIMITIIIIVMIETSIAIMNTGNDIIFTSE